MHSLLEQYLSEVAVHLEPMPVKHREEELREMRAHLENAVIVSRELGQSEEEAAQNVVAQFGTPKDLGGSVVWAWKRGESKWHKRSFWIATGCTFAILTLTSLLTACLPVGPGFGALIGGMICGSLFWKRSTAGVALGTALYYHGFGMSAFIYGVTHLGQMHLHLMGPLSGCVLSFFAGQTEAALLALLVAWIASRLRRTWNKRRRMVRA